MVNAFNFLDGLDGLVAGVAVVSAIAIACWRRGPHLPCCCRLRRPWPASSMEHGAGANLHGRRRQPIRRIRAGGFRVHGWGHEASAIPALLVFLPVLADAAITILRRMLTGRSPFQADRNHVFHGLAKAGFKHRTVANLYYGLSGLSALIGFVYIGADDLGKLLLVGCSWCHGRPLRSSRWYSRFARRSRHHRERGIAEAVSPEHTCEWVSWRGTRLLGTRGLGCSRCSVFRSSGRSASPATRENFWVLNEDAVTRYARECTAIRACALSRPARLEHYRFRQPVQSQTRHVPSARDDFAATPSARGG